MTDGNNATRGQRHDTILDAIGSTPLVRLDAISPRGGATVWGKCEFLNPGGSAKDRIGVRIIERAEREGLLAPGGTVVEATSGNTAIALAQACAVKGYACVLVMPEKVSEEKRAIARAYGASVVITPKVAPDHPEHYCRVAQRIAHDTPDAYYADQFRNPAATDAHADATGPEIWQQLDGDVAAFVADARVRRAPS